RRDADRAAPRVSQLARSRTGGRPRGRARGPDLPAHVQGHRRRRPDLRITGAGTVAGTDRPPATHLGVPFSRLAPFPVPVGEEVRLDPPEANQQLALQRFQDDVGALARLRAHVVVVTTPMSMGPRPSSMSLNDAVRAKNWNERWNDFLRAAVAPEPQVATVLDPNGHMNDPNWVVSWLGPELARRGQSWSQQAGTTLSTLVEGDSTALTLAPGLARVADPRELLVLNRARFNCGTMPGQI